MLDNQVLNDATRQCLTRLAEIEAERGDIAACLDAMRAALHLDQEHTPAAARRRIMCRRTIRAIEAML